MTAITGKDVGKKFMEDWDIATAKCAVKDCANHKHEGLFVGLLCSPCHTFISGDGGLYSQAYRNSRAMIDTAITLEREACATECEPHEDYPSEHANAIRARSQ